LSSAEDAADSSSTAKRLTTPRERHLEKAKQRDRERREEATFISLSDPLLQGAVAK